MEVAGVKQNWQIIAALIFAFLAFFVATVRDNWGKL